MSLLKFDIFQFIKPAFSASVVDSLDNAKSPESRICEQILCTARTVANTTLTS